MDAGREWKSTENKKAGMVSIAGGGGSTEREKLARGPTCVRACAHSLILSALLQKTVSSRRTRGGITIEGGKHAGTTAIRISSASKGARQLSSRRCVPCSSDARSVRLWVPLPDTGRKHRQWRRLAFRLLPIFAAGVCRRGRLAPLYRVPHPHLFALMPSTRLPCSWCVHMYVCAYVLICVLPHVRMTPYPLSESAFSPAQSQNKEPATHRTRIRFVKRV